MVHAYYIIISMYNLDYRFIKYFNDIDVIKRNSENILIQSIVNNKLQLC